MKERPILFSAPMIRALLAGTKTQTRRIVKPQQPKPSKMPPYEFELTERDGAITAYTVAQFVASRHNRHGQSGDRLWVRETWCRASADSFYEPHVAEGRPRGPEKYSSIDQQHFAWYRATDPDVVHEDDHSRSPWRPSIFMPRWASRITLAITQVRVERLHDIDELGALAEGVEGQSVEGVLNGVRGEYIVGSARDDFARLWAGINGAESWKANPFVWVIEFERVNDVVA